MAELPVILSDEMVRAILDGRKTETRRPITRVRGIGKVGEFQPSSTPGYDWIMRAEKTALWNDFKTADLLARLPFGAVGDTLWVREAHMLTGYTFNKRINGSWVADWREEPNAWKCIYRADDKIVWGTKRGERTVISDDMVVGSHWTRWRPSIHMPRWASRIELEVTRIWIEMLQDISAADIRAEGTAQPDTAYTLFGPFIDLWNGIYGTKEYDWYSNPGVVAREFRVKEASE